MKRFLLYTLVFIIISIAANAQSITPLYEQKGLSFRGLSAVSDSIVWVSGSKGTVGKSLDGGATWSWHIVPGYENRDFRDIEAFDDQRAVIIAIDSPAHILYTIDGGLNWELALEDNRKGMFLDAMYFENEAHGFVIGDAVEGDFYLAETKDGGRSWLDISGRVLQKPDSVEAFFAASGTNIIFHEKDLYAVSGGYKSFLHKNGDKYPLPLLSGSSNTGANGMIVHDEKFLIVGGDFTKPHDTTGNFVMASFSNNQFVTTQPVKAPSGYRSGIAHLENKTLITVGMNGVDWSTDLGVHWHQISTTGYHTIKKAKHGKTVFLAGGNGRIAKFNPTKIQP